MKGNSEGNSWDIFFPLYTGVTLPMYVPTTGFRLMVLRNIRVEKILLRLPVLQWNKHPTQFNLKKLKRENLKSVIVHCQRSLISQFLFLVFIQYVFERQIPNVLINKFSKIVIGKDFPLKFFHKKNICITIW